MDKEISAVDTAFLLKSTNAAILDVREENELSICRIEGALHIPMVEVPDRYAELPKDAPLIVFCHHGMRSLKVVEYLKARGLENAINLTGGIHAWANEVDAEMPRY
jgi:rhodanese-related sulfurtransferase